jgi:hypothetical protein
MSLSEYWASPKVACNRHYLNYLVVAEVGLPPAARARSAGDSSSRTSASAA